MTVLQSWNLEWQEKEFVICGGVYFRHRWNFSHTHTHTHTHTHRYIYIYIYISVAFLVIGNEKCHLVVLTRWLAGWVSQTHQVENNDNAILDVFSVSEHLESNTTGGARKF